MKNEIETIALNAIDNELDTLRSIKDLGIRFSQAISNAIGNADCYADANGVSAADLRKELEKKF